MGNLKSKRQKKKRGEKHFSKIFKYITWQPLWGKKLPKQQKILHKEQGINTSET